MTPIIASAITPAGRGAISTIVIRGNGAVEMALEFLHLAGPRQGELPEGRIVFGRWMRGDNRAGEEVVASRQSTPQGDQVEVHCHGGDAAREAILADLQRAGAERVDWQEWLRQSAVSVTRAQAHLALPFARTYRTARILLDQANGALDLAIANLSASLEADIGEAQALIETLLTTADLGMHLASAWQVAIVGPPNVGKSSLVNAILGYQRSIVHDVPGTTRDVLTAGTAVDGWPFEFADTAGMRETEEPIESVGIQLAQQRAKQADLVVCVFDVSQRWNDSCERFVHGLETECFIVQNKLDLVASVPSDRPCDAAVSAQTKSGLEALLKKLSSRLVPHPPATGAAVIFDPWQKQLFERALKALQTHDLAAAKAALTEFGVLAKDR